MAETLVHGNAGHTERRARPFSGHQLQVRDDADDDDADDDDDVDDDDDDDDDDDNDDDDDDNDAR